MRRFIATSSVLAFAICIMVFVSTVAQSTDKLSDAVVDEFIVLLSGDSRKIDKALDRIELEWQPSFAIMAVEVITLIREREAVGRLVSLLEENTGQEFGFDMQGWRTWLWNQPENDYAYLHLHNL